MLIIYLAVVLAAMYWVVKTLAPEMAKPALPQAAPEPDSVDSLEFDEDEKKIERLEILVAEKNRSISLLETELKVFQTQASSFDKLKALLEEEIKRLREQNRIFRSELGLPTARPKENSIV
jgi:hypothetical protein